MNNIYKLYNNEALVSRILKAILIIQKRENIARLYFITIILLNDSIRRKISGFTLISDTSSFYAACSSELSSLGIDFEKMLPVLINSLTILAEEGILAINDKYIAYIGEPEENISKSLRLTNIIECIPKLLSLLNSVATSIICHKLHIRL